MIFFFKLEVWLTSIILGFEKAEAGELPRIEGQPGLWGKFHANWILEQGVCVYSQSPHLLHPVLWGLCVGSAHLPPFSLA